MIEPMTERRGYATPIASEWTRGLLKEDDLIYFIDDYGKTRSITKKEYETNAGSRTVVNERLGFIAGEQEANIRTLQGNDGGTREPSETKGESSGQPIPPENGKKEITGESLVAETRAGKKDTRPTRILE